MKRPLRILLATLLLAAPAAWLAGENESMAQAPPKNAQPPVGKTTAEPLPEQYSCTFCHADPEVLPPNMPRLLVTPKKLQTDIHWQKGLRCHDCHGGNPNLPDFKEHRDDPSFHAIETPADVPGFCGRCHSSVEYMRHYEPSPRTDQVTEYWTSGHGMRLKKVKDDTDVATCVSCHGHHGIRAVNDLQSPVYPTHVADTCAKCHADPERMKGRTYHGKPLGYEQYHQWKQSVHAVALLKKGDLSAPTCNDCHGNHGAVPPDVDSVANACGSCHVKVATLFSQTVMKHRFERVDWEGLPGCAACHSNHLIRHPTDAMLGMGEKALCSSCHGQGGGKYPDALAGKTAQGMSTELEQLKRQIAAAEEKLDEAENLGMEVRDPRFRLKKARDALTNARALIHAFAVDPVKLAVDQGMGVAVSVEQDGQKQLEEYTYRRVWLAVSLAPILIAVGLLLLYIRTLPISGR